VLQADGYNGIEGETTVAGIGEPVIVDLSNWDNTGLIKLVENEKEQITPEALKGGFKADAGKSRVDLIPPDVLLELGNLYALGAAKYADDNWKLGMEFKRVYSAMMRHTLKWWAGEELDSVDGQHHLDSVIWCAVALRYYMLHYEKYKEFDSRTNTPVRAEEGNQK
jgi:hypothetical protein